MSSLLKYKKYMMKNRWLIIVPFLLVVILFNTAPIYEKANNFFSNMGREVSEEKVAYQGFVDVPNIYYSSNNGKRSKLILMDLAIEVEDPDTEKKFNNSRPIIKSEILKILSSDNYRHIGDDQLLAYINDNVNRDLTPVLQEIGTIDALAAVYVTRLIIQ